MSRIARAGCMGLILSTVLAFYSPVLPAGEPGRLDDDTGFLLGNWSNNCEAGSAKIFLKDGALRQKGFVQLPAPGETRKLITPVTLLAATRDGANIVLEAKTQQAGSVASARYSGLIENERQLRLKNMTVCQADRCRSAVIDLPWKRCPATD